MSTLWCYGGVLAQPVTRVPLCRFIVLRSVALSTFALSCLAGGLEAGIRGLQRSGTRVPRRSALCSNCRPLPVQYPQLVSFTAASPATGGRDVFSVTRFLPPCTTGACSDWPNGFRLVHQGIQRPNKWGKWTLDISHVDSFDPGLYTAQFRLTRPTLDGGSSSEPQKKGQYILPCCCC